MMREVRIVDGEVVTIADNPQERRQNACAMCFVRRGDSANACQPCVDRDHWKAESARLRESAEKLTAIAHVPGTWICPTCSYVEVRSVLSSTTGGIRASDVPALPCPNDGQFMERMTWKQRALDLRNLLDGAAPSAPDGAR